MDDNGPTVSLHGRTEDEVVVVVQGHKDTKQPHIRKKMLEITTLIDCSHACVQQSQQPTNHPAGFSRTARITLGLLYIISRCGALGRQATHLGEFTHNAYVLEYMYYVRTYCTAQRMNVGLGGVGWFVRSLVAWSTNYHSNQFVGCSAVARSNNVNARCARESGQLTCQQKYR